MLENLFGNIVIEKVLFYLLVNDKGYASKMRRALDIPLYSVQRALMRLERGGIIVAQTEGKTVVYHFSPRYPFLDELKALLKKSYASLPEKIKDRYYQSIERTRPRRRGKPLKKVKDND